MSTIRDIVRLSGVSSATVSRVLNGSPNVLPETRKKVLDAIEALDYHPNKLAQQFRTQMTHQILVLLPRLGDSFYSEILRGIETIAYETDYHVFFANTNGQPSWEKSYFELLIQKQVDGIINFSATLPTEYLNSIAEQYPIVVGCRYLQGAIFPSVTIDNMAASAEMTNYMLGLGHRRVAYLCGDTNLHIYRSRMSGFQQAMKERNVPIDDSMVIVTDGSVQSGYEATMRLLQSGAEFTAVITSGDSLAIGALKALQDNHISIPDDVAISGFDDIEMSSLLIPALTTIRQPRYQIGRRAMEKMLERIRSNRKKHSNYNNAEQIVLEHELIIRASSGKFIGV